MLSYIYLLKKHFLSMYISTEKNSVILSNSETIISNGENIFIKNPNFVTVFYPDGSLTDTAVFKEKEIIRPKNSLLTDLKEDILLAFFKRPFYNGFKLIAQDNINGAKVTVFIENTLKVMIETSEFSELFCYPFLSKSASIHGQYYYNGLYILVFFSDINKLFCYFVSNSIKEVLSVNAVDYNLSNTLTVTEILPDIARHKIVKTYSTEKELTLINQVVLDTAENYPYRLSDKLIPFAFLEELLIGGNYERFLSSELKEKANLLNGYFGNFTGVCPCPFSIDKTGVIYKCDKSEKFDYKVKYLLAEVSGGKINNLTLED